jgi:hypothetical protein
MFSLDVPTLSYHRSGWDLNVPKCNRHVLYTGRYQSYGSIRIVLSTKTSSRLEELNKYQLQVGRLYLVDMFRHGH